MHCHMRSRNSGARPRRLNLEYDVLEVAEEVAYEVAGEVVPV